MEMWARTWKFSGSLSIWWQSKSKSSFCGRKIAIAIGETVESVCAMQEKERKELMEVLGLKVEIFLYVSNEYCGSFTILKVEDQLEILDSDDEPLKDNHDNDNIYVDSEDEDLAQALAASRTAAAAIEIADEDEEEVEEEDAGTRTGWGECPMCTEVAFQILAD